MEREMITAEMLRRRIIFDCMADPQKAFLLAGMIGVSEDVAEKEEEESMRRLAGIEAILPILTTISSWLAETAMNFQLQSVAPEDIPDEFRDHMAGMFFSVVQGALCSTFAVLNDLDMIDIKVVVADGCS
jgi:hypothetical protein